MKRFLAALMVVFMLGVLAPTSAMASKKCYDDGRVVSCTGSCDLACKIGIIIGAIVGALANLGG